jgi:hypothetical protein
MNVFIGRRFSQYERAICDILLNGWRCPVTTFLTDARCRPENGKPTYASVSVVLLEEIDNEREELVQWLEWVTENVRQNSDQVLVLLFSDDPERNITDYNKIGMNMKVDCLRYTIEDDFNKKIIIEKILNYKSMF